MSRTELTCLLCGKLEAHGDEAGAVADGWRAIRLHKDSPVYWMCGCRNFKWFRYHAEQAELKRLTQTKSGAEPGEGQR